MGTSVGWAWLKDSETLDTVVAEAGTAHVRLSAQLGGFEEALKALQADASRPDYVLLQLACEHHCAETVEQAAQHLAELLAECAPKVGRIPASIIFIGPRIGQDEAEELFDAGLLAYINRDKLHRLVDELERLEVARRESGAAIDPTRLISIVGAAGGVGTSLIASNIAWASAHRRPTTLLVDVDANSGVQAGRFALDERRGMDELSRLLTQPTFDHSMLAGVTAGRMVDDLPGKLAVLSGRLPTSETVAIPCGGVQRLVLEAQRTFEAVILDAGHRAYQPRRELYSGALIVVATPTRDALMQAASLWADAESYGCPKRLLVLNKLGEHQEGCPLAAEFADALAIEQGDIIQMPFDGRRVTSSIIQSQPALPLVDQPGHLGDALRQVAAFALGGAAPPKKRNWLQILWGED